MIRRLCALVVSLAAMAPVSALAQVDRAAAETQIKAAFLYKFSAFVEWPPKAFARPDSPFTIGVIGADELAAELEQIVRGRTVLERAVVVRRMRRGEPVTGIQILFIGQAEGARLAEILAIAKGQSVLTVTESEDALSHGSMINFVFVDDKVRFDVAPVRRKLLAVVLLTTLTALLVAIAVMVGFDLRNYRQSLISDMTTQADLLGRTTAPALTFDDPRVAQENLELLRYRPQIRAAAIYNARGKMFASYSNKDSGEFPKLPEADGTRVEGNELVLFKRVVGNREILGTVYLRADYELYDRLVGYLGIAAVVAAIAMLVAYVLSRQLQHIVTSPLLAIAEVAREVTEKRAFSLRAPKLSKDEIGMLAESFNTMLAEIERATRDLQASNEVLGREIAEHNRAEQEILRLNTELEQRVKERTAQLEFTNGELEAFCYSVSHDLRAPLRAIDGFSQALLEDFPKDVPEEAQRYLSRIRSSTQRMGQLIEDLLNLSRVSRGGLERRDADISDLARQVVTELQTREPQRKVDISIWDGMRANADSRLLRAALENLIGNAWKFSSKTDQPRIEIGSLSDDGRAVFYVRDNGAGFDMAYANKLFGAFQRLHSGNEYQGTGIGLATVQRIVHRHGGRIWADAKPGKGAAFYFTLESDGVEKAGRDMVEAQA